MTPILRYPWQSACLALLCTSGLFGGLWARERDRRLVEYARAESALEAVEPIRALADSATALAARYDSIAGVAERELDRARAALADRQLEALVEREVVVAVTLLAGATLDATLDSLAADPLTSALAARLIEQVGAERRGWLAERAARDRQQFAAFEMVALADSATALLQGRLDASETARLATVAALNQMQAALGSRIPEPAWTDGTAFKLGVLGLAVWGGYQWGTR